MCDDFMFVFELDPEGSVREQFRHDTGKFQEFFFCHSSSTVRRLQALAAENGRENLADWRNFHNRVRRPMAYGRIGWSFVATSPPPKPSANLLHELIADVAIGLEALLAAAFQPGRRG